MKRLLLILPLFFLMPACEETEELTSRNKANGFFKVEDQLFVSSKEDKDNFLIIEDVDNIAKHIQVFTYEEGPFGDTSNENTAVFYCDTEFCKTNETDSKYNTIELQNNLTRVTIKRFIVNNNNDTDSHTSTWHYDLIKN